MACALVAATAPAASALVVHGRNHHFLGIQLRRGISAAAVPGSVAAQHPAAQTSDDGTLTYHGGPVVHSSAPYLIFWDPKSRISTGSQSLMENYFTDVAADRSESDDVYGLTRQYTDSSGFAGGGQTFDPNTQGITDTQPYPPTDITSCPRTTYRTCVTDAQIQQELGRLIAAQQLPTDGASGSAALPQNAPVYFVVLPGNVNVCDGTVGCASSNICAYHSSTTVGDNTIRNTVLYAAIPMLLAENNPKLCQADGSSAAQEPNGDPADIVIGDLSHESNEVITDPLGTGWYDNISGNEEADGCSVSGSFSPANQTDPAAFLPTLGGDATAGTLYDQLINNDQYYTQSEWSNGDGTCEMRSTGGTIDPNFSESSGSNYMSWSFDPGASTSDYPISSETWDFGDGSAPEFHAGGLAGVSHTYTSTGTYTMQLTLVDDRGDLQTTTRRITVGDEPPTVAFTVSTGPYAVGERITVNGSATADPDGTISSYSWSFGGGSAASEPTATHTYNAVGTYTIGLTVTDSDGQTNTTWQQITVHSPPATSFGFSPAVPSTGVPVSFDGSGSSDPEPGVAIASYVWNFGDGSTGFGETAGHAFAAPGTYPVTLTVTNSVGLTNASSRQITVYSPPAASFGFSPPAPLAGMSVSFDGRDSSDPNTGVAIGAYGWNFGDGSSGSGSTPSHTYSNSGNYIVTLTVTDSVGLTASRTQQITVFPLPPSASLLVNTPHPAAGVPVKFNGSSSSAWQGSITSYSWSFGDGGHGIGVAPVHTYRTAGTYRVSLTVFASSGMSASTSRLVVVVPGSRIKKISILGKRGSAQLAITLTGPGGLSVSARRFAIARAGTLNVRLTPTGAQRRRLQTSHRLTLKVRVAFVPNVGRPSTNQLSITLRG